MKKVFYSIGVVCAMLFTACSSEDRGTTTEVVDANSTENVDPSTLNDYDQPGTAASTASTNYTDASYQQHAQVISDQMRTDLQLDDATATEITRIYYDRNRQLGDMEQGSSFSATERMGGRTDETSDMNNSNTGTGTDMNTNNNTMGNNAGTNNMGNTATDRTQIDATTDRELKSLLTPEQYRRYEQNRDRYNNMQFNNNSGTNMNNSGTGTGSNNTTGTSTNNNMNKGTGNNTNTSTGSGTERPTGGNQ